jgi:hypothetical protein
MNIHDPGVHVTFRCISPHILQDFAAAEGFARATHEQFQEAELHSGEADPFVGSEHLTLIGVDAKI